MEFNRNHYFLIGFVILLLGIQFRMVESFVLNEKASQMVAKNFKKQSEVSINPVALFLPAVGPAPRHVVRPPKWLGWALISVGGVLVLHALAMKKPGG